MKKKTPPTIKIAIVAGQRATPTASSSFASSVARFVRAILFPARVVVVNGVCCLAMLMLRTMIVRDRWAAAQPFPRISDEDQGQNLEGGLLIRGL